ncbi:hypothetical protein EC973_000156 [Apophysomyces ossiformis]|uniref:MIR domain-containing protein n=1 Tax=Apophysomyces ossiformis TaxID=679940 RepID=A0A8H7EUD5_9FUNG|nr:hypothetical protein EC973_000156 [Apophysomyces ossiformis]
MTGRYLTSSYEHYEGGSGQQQVFAGGWQAIPEATWIVIPPFHVTEEPGVPIRYGDTIRLKHVVTRRNLHSHPDWESPVTGQQEVTAFGGDFESDNNDYWRVEPWIEEEKEEEEEYNEFWHVGQSFMLRHVETGVTLHEESLTEESNEVTGFQEGPDENDRWRVKFEDEEEEEEEKEEEEEEEEEEEDEEEEEEEEE